jgi:hypothetical protein
VTGIHGASPKRGYCNGRLARHRCDAFNLNEFAKARLLSARTVASVRAHWAAWFARRRLGLAKADQTGDVSSVPLGPATCFTVGSALDEEHVRKPNLSKRLRRDAQD